MPKFQHLLPINPRNKLIVRSNLRHDTEHVRGGMGMFTISRESMFMLLIYAATKSASIRSST